MARGEEEDVAAAEGRGERGKRGDKDEYGENGEHEKQLHSPTTPAYPIPVTFLVEIHPIRLVGLERTATAILDDVAQNNAASIGSLGHEVSR